MTWLGLVGLWVVLGVGMCGLLWLTDYADLRPESHRDRVTRARRDIR